MTSPKPPETQRGLERALPHSLDAERALLGSMLLDESAINEAISVLQGVGAPAFWFEKHGRLYDLILELWKQNKPIDGVVIKDELVRRGLFEQFGGYEFLSDLVSSVPSALRAREYATLVLDKYLLRRLINATHRVMDAAFDDSLPASDILELAQKEVFDVTEQRMGGTTHALPDLIHEVFRQIEQLDGSMLTGEPSGFPELDEMTCGFQPGELVIIAGRPSMGKTALGLNIAEHLAMDHKQPRPVLFFSLEMSRQQVAQRILCSRARVNAHRLRRGMHSRDDLERLQRVADEARDKPLFVDDTPSLSILELRARARMVYRKHRIRAIFVDYLQLAHAPGCENRQQEVASISRGLKALAKDLNVPVVALAQLNRKPEDRTGNRPKMSDLRESGAIEQDADLILLLHRDTNEDRTTGEERDPRAELIIAKQRNGPVGTVNLHFDERYTRFSSYDPGRRFEDVPEAQAVAEEAGDYADPTPF